ncbi:FAD-dependent monooxygenase [Bradyrhizobium sp. dw_78]|uniref:FAD-dependent monooxygenase n=1 Tax=Bradyrhizobium sp. dw_78 TaxID=2719793 RepID=UPI001BD69DE2|nr:FAD-dependent monooxygenase [Bradyrhizobium sp. dw_78]
MPDSQSPKSRSVLISGASIAGPALAYWLDRYGFDVTVVERAPTVRSGGYPIDVRGTAIDVVERMGLLPRVQAAHIGSRELRFVDAEGAVIGSIPPYELTNNQTGRDVELPRGALATLLYDLTKERPIRYRFNDSIDSLGDDGSGVEIQFKSGDRCRYDVVIGADGLHSRTRRLAFGPEQQFNHYLGSCFNIFSMPNDMGLSHGGIIYGEAGRSAGVFAVRNSKEVFGFLIFASDKPPFGTHPDVEEQYTRTEAVFADGGWEVPRLLQAMRHANDLFFDTVSQIRMPAWSSGRVALAGDAAYAPSFRSGQGTSLALVGAYVLAGELAAHDDPSDAFAAYERMTRPFVEANQALAIEGNGFILLPRTPQELEARNRILAALAEAKGDAMRNDHARDVHSMLSLPDYAR